MMSISNWWCRFFSCSQQRRSQAPMNLLSFLFERATGLRVSDAACCLKRGPNMQSREQEEEAPLPNESNHHRIFKASCSMKLSAAALSKHKASHVEKSPAAMPSRINISFIIVLVQFKLDFFVFIHFLAGTNTLNTFLYLASCILCQHQTVFFHEKIILLLKLFRMLHERYIAMITKEQQ